MQKIPSKLGIQYIFDEFDKENFQKKVHQKQNYIKPYISKWNSKIKISYPTEKYIELKTFLKEKNPESQSAFVKQLMMQLQSFVEEEIERFDLNEIYVGVDDNVYFILLPESQTNQTMKLENLEKNLLMISSGNTDIRSQEKCDFSAITFRSTNSNNCFSIKDEITTIGKSSEKSDIVIQGSPSVSRRHCRIIKKEEKYFIEDLGSLNHTYKNGILIETGKSVEIEKGDIIKLSDIIFEIE